MASHPTSPPPKLKPVDSNPQPQQQPADLTDLLIPSLQKLYQRQNKLNATWTPSSLHDIFLHCFKYPSQTTFGLTIGQFVDDTLHIVEVVPLSHLTSVPNTVLLSGLEITNSRISKSSSLNNFKEEIAMFASTGSQSSPSDHNGQGPSGHVQQQFQRGVTMNEFMDSVEDLIKKEEQKRLDQQQLEQKQIASFQETGQLTALDQSDSKPNIFQETRAGQAQFVEKMEQNGAVFNAQDQFICGCYICPSPVPKINSAVLSALSAFDQNNELYETAAQMYLHASLKQIPAAFLNFFYRLTTQCPNPILTIVDPILLNINTEAYNQHCGIMTLTKSARSKAGGSSDIEIPASHSFSPPLPSLVTYFLHDDVLLEVTSEDLLGTKPLADLLFLDKVFTLEKVDASDLKNPHSTPVPESFKISVDQNERPFYPVVTSLEAGVWEEIMGLIKKEAQLTLIDWQETLLNE